jgi:RNA polymerase sigma factor (sigma-70 family)
VEDPAPQSNEARSSPRAELDSWFRNEVQPHETELRRFLAGYAPAEDIDDLVQETYVRLLRSRGQRPLFHLRAMLLAIGRNAALDLFRRRRTVSITAVGEIEALDVFDSGPGAPEIVSLRQENLLLEDAIRDLPDRCRAVLILRRIEGLSHREIADRLQISVKTVEAQITKAIQRCTAHLDKHGAMPGSWTKGAK